jgi:hypothetical protein
MASIPSLCRTEEAQVALDRIADPGARVFANMLFALVVQRAFGDSRIETGMEIDAHFLVQVFAEYFSDRDAVYKALALGDGDGLVP